MIPSAIGIPVPSEKTSTTENWANDQLIEYLTRSNSELIPQDEMPQSIELSPDIIDSIERRRTDVQKDLSRGNTRDVVDSTYYSYQRIRIAEDVDLDTVYYNCHFESKLPSGMANHPYPPEPELLVPILDSNRFKANEARGYLCASNKIALLFLRTKETMQIAGNKTEPRYFSQAKLPNWFIPNISGNSIRSMHNFKLMCHHARLAVFARPAFPNSENYTLFEKLELPSN